MRVSFSREKTVTPAFNGNENLPEEERLRYRLKPMTLGDFADALEQMRRLGLKDNSQSPAEMGADEQKNFLLLASKVLPKYVESAGAKLLTSDGQEVTIDQVMSEAPFMSLVGELFWSLIVHSQPTEIDVKN